MPITNCQKLARGVLRLPQGPAIIRLRPESRVHFFPEHYTLVDITVQSSESRHPLLFSSWGARAWLRIVHSSVGLFFRYWCQVRIEGADHIPAQGGVLLASNHISLIDPVLISYTVMAAQRMQIVWAPAKVELFRVPFLGALLTSLGAFPVRRGQGDVRAMRRMIKHMQTEKLLLFPEGTRSHDGRLHRANRTVGKLLHEARPVVIPTAVWGTDRVLPPGRYVPRWHAPIGVCYGKPLDLQRYYALPGTKETAAAIVQELMQAIAVLLAIDRSPVTVASTETSR